MLLHEGIADLCQANGATQCYCVQRAPNKVNSSAKLPLLTKRALDLYMPKDDTDTFSRWNRTVLENSQVKYAALDVIASLLLFEKLQMMTDLEQRLTKKYVKVNDEVDIVPNSGASKGMMATRAATGTVVEMVNCRSPGEKSYWACILKSLS